MGDYAAPGRGGDWGRRVGAAASQLFELELDGLSNEDREFGLEPSRYVQWARSAARMAANASARQTAPPRQSLGPRRCRRRAAMRPVC